ncbi:MAG: histidine triad nucleotide-binding protein [Clostridiales bacterium]|jgi:histidine triad (HIT) family protein|nr:histidine triad nucleotide-binding protein [Clostridiales bacterium]
MSDNCLFCKIIKGDIPSTRVYEDDDCLVIPDINPIAPRHYLLLPKTHYATLADMTAAEAATLARCLQKIPTLTETLGLTDGYRLVINQGKNAGQTVFHLHVHILAGRALTWNA